MVSRLAGKHYDKSGAIDLSCATQAAVPASGSVGIPEILAFSGSNVPRWRGQGSAMSPAGGGQGVVGFN
ncbi:MAG: hypothetical protein PHN75_04680, partial [Syntrophales bacterium]|nr:hypothetical protein [Syntrophales bacterium]